MKAQHTNAFWIENERQIKIAVMGTDEERKKLAQQQQKEKLNWAQEVGVASHQTFLKMNPEARMLQLEAEEILIQQKPENPLKKWMKRSAKQKENHWFTKHVHEPETKEEFEALMEDTRFGQLVKAFKKQLKMTEPYVDALKLSLAVILSTKFKDDTPLWLDIVGSPGTGKTVLLRSLAAISYTVFKSRITPAALVSGDVRRKIDPSLLPKLKGKCLIWKDFTEVLNMKAEEKSKIYDTLRGAYDGTVNVDYGTGASRNYTDVYFAMIAGVTNDTYLDDIAALGERRLKFKLPPEDTSTQKAKMEKAFDASESSGEGAQELQQACTAFVEACDILTLPFVSKRIKQRLISFALVIASLRAQVHREKYDTLHSILLKPEAEQPMRLAKQLKKLAQMVAIVMDEPKVTEEIFDLMLKVGLSTPHPHRVQTFHLVNSMNGEMITKDDIIEKTNISRTTLSRTLYDMEAIGIVRREKGGGIKDGGRKPDKWKLAKEIRELWSEV
jgi:hypothetical protein